MSNYLESKSLQALTDLVRAKIDSATGDWQKPFKWIENTNGLPRNVFSKKAYSGWNTLFLAMSADESNYHLGGWATFKQYSENGIFIKKGEKCSIVNFWNKEYVLISDPKQRISADDYEALPAYEKELYKARFMFCEYRVFNVAQTNMKEAKPELYAKIEKMFEPDNVYDERGMYRNESIDKMILDQSFICPIQLTVSDKAFYNKTLNSIRMPLKIQFTDGEKFYVTLAHECAHATMVPLKRESGGKFGDEKYAREEFVAEIAAALTGMQLGFSTTIENHNAQYLKNWERALSDEAKKSNEFLYNVVKDAVKASDFVLNCLNIKATQVA